MTSPLSLLSNPPPPERSKSPDSIGEEIARAQRMVPTIPLELPILPTDTKETIGWMKEMAATIAASAGLRARLIEPTPLPMEQVEEIGAAEPPPTTGKKKKTQGPFRHALPYIMPHKVIYDSGFPFDFQQKLMRLFYPPTTKVRLKGEKRQEFAIGSPLDRDGTVELSSLKGKRRARIEALTHYTIRTNGQVLCVGTKDLDPYIRILGKVTHSHRGQYTIAPTQATEEAAIILSSHRQREILFDLIKVTQKNLAHWPSHEVHLNFSGRNIKAVGYDLREMPEP